MAGQQSAAVSVTGVSRRFGDLLALNELSLTVAGGEFVAVVGPSGCGKSTLLRLLCGLEAPDAGTISAPRAALLPQGGALLPWLDAAGNAALALALWGLPAGPARRRAGELLAELGLAGFERARSWELSGGMAQRVAVARTLLSGAPVLCLDEPLGALDALTRAAAQRWLAATLAGSGRTVVLVTHDTEEAALLADRILVLSPRPGTVVTEVAVDRPRTGREPDDPVVLAARRQVLTALTDAAPGGHEQAGASR